MKTAEEYAEQIFWYIDKITLGTFKESWKRLIKTHTLKNIEAFGYQRYEEGLKEALSCPGKEIKLARRYALEEAAKIADYRGWKYLKDSVVGYPEGMRDGADLIAQEIRALIDDGEGK